VRRRKKLLRRQTLKSLPVTLELGYLGILRPRMLFFIATGIFSKNKKVSY
jgi:hypothetical protein